jgi:signal transduction histidine kinase
VSHYALRVEREHARRNALQDNFDLATALLDVMATVAVKEQVVQDRTGRWYTLVIHPYRTGDNHIDGVVLVLRDIDDEKRTKDRLARASGAKDQFMAVLSHELRTPLTPVLATVTMLQRNGSFDADTQEQLEVIRRNAEIEVRLIGDGDRFKLEVNYNWKMKEFIIDKVEILN